MPAENTGNVPELKYLLLFDVLCHEKLQPHFTSPSLIQWNNSHEIISLKIFHSRVFKEIQHSFSRPTIMLDYFPFLCCPDPSGFYHLPEPMWMQHKCEWYVWIMSKYLQWLMEKMKLHFYNLIWLLVKRCPL